MNAIGTQLRDPILDSGLIRWRLAVYADAATESGSREMNPRVSTSFRPSVENKRADAVRDGRTSLPKQNSQARVRTMKIILPVQPTTSQNRLLTSLHSSTKQILFLRRSLCFQPLRGIILRPTQFEPTLCPSEEGSYY